MKKIENEIEDDREEISNNMKITNFKNRKLNKKKYKYTIRQFIEKCKKIMKIQKYRKI
jgi:hypothetical protein